MPLKSPHYTSFEIATGIGMGKSYYPQECSTTRVDSELEDFIRYFDPHLWTMTSTNNALDEEDTVEIISPTRARLEDGIPTGGLR